jgi:predicted nuclease of predicted toxin-antitoxin system
MVVKLDENLGERGRQLLIAAGHQVATVGEQGLAGGEDPEIIEVCRSEGRCLVTLDRRVIRSGDRVSFIKLESKVSPGPFHERTQLRRHSPRRHVS